MILLNKRSKSVTTLGPASNDEIMIQKLVENGSNCVRLNFSHGDHEEHKQRIVATRKVAQKLNVPIAIMLDTKGPEIRTHNFTNGHADIVKDSIITIIDNKEIIGNEKTFSVNYNLLCKDIKKGNLLLVDDGKLQLEVLSVNNHEVTVKALNTHTVKDHRGINIPNIALSLPFISEKDKEDLIFGCEQKVDFVAASFVNSAQDVNEMRKILQDNNGSDIKIVSKIESQLAVKNFDEILAVSDAIMVARGDLGVEISFQEVPYYEFEWIKKCQKANKPVIVATQMLDSMVSNPHPTRAEVTDVYVAVQWGASSTMLSGESANGSYPDLAIATMTKIIQEAERHYEYKNHQSFVDYSHPVVKNIMHLIEKDKPDYLIINDSSTILKTISNLHLPVIIMPLLTEEKEFRSFALNYGVYPLLTKNIKEIIESNSKLKNLVNKTYNLKKDYKVLVVNIIDENKVVFSYITN